MAMSVDVVSKKRKLAVSCSRTRGSEGKKGSSFICFAERWSELAAAAAAVGGNSVRRLSTARLSSGFALHRPFLPGPTDTVENVMSRRRRCENFFAEKIREKKIKNQLEEEESGAEGCLAIVNHTSSSQGYGPSHSQIVTQSQSESPCCCFITLRVAS